jgi:hypothetical protein
MPALKNIRHERFVGFLLEGLNATDAHEKAGYTRSRSNACHLQARPKVQARLAELRAEIRKEQKITVGSICAELDEANSVAKQKGQASAMVSASALRAKLAGLLIEKVEVATVNELDHCETFDQIAEVTFKQLIADADHLSAVDLDRLNTMGQQWQKLGEAIAELCTPPREIPLARGIHRRQTNPARINNKPHNSIIQLNNSEYSTTE